MILGICIAALAEMVVGIASGLDHRGKKMGIGRKVDYPPLLPPGRHCLPIGAVKEICCDPFPGNGIRLNLYYALEQMFQDFLIADIPCYFWINGSYVTEKDEPGDLDVTVIIDAQYVGHITEIQRILIDKANDGDYTPGLSSFVFVALPREHPDFGGQHDMAAETARTYGKENSEQWLKGFIVLRAN